MNESYPVGPVTREKAAKTKAGALARAMHELLYCGDVHTSESRHSKQYRVCEELYLDTKINVPEHIRISGRASYISANKLLREVRDYLQFESLRQVIP